MVLIKDPNGSTPTPWPQPTYHNDTGPVDGFFVEWWEVEGVGRFEYEADARRAVACVNACAGIANPAAIPELLKKARQLALDSKSLAEELWILFDILEHPRTHHA